MAVRVSSPVLIGRARELERLEAAVEAARNGRSSAVLIAGEAGVGKTRLISELMERSDASGITALVGGCIDLHEGALPYAPVVEALRGYIRQGDPDEVAEVIGPARSDLARLLPDLGPAPSASSSMQDVGSQQGRLFELLLGMLERLAALRPVLLVIEDLHWSDQSTRDLIAFLVRNLRDSGVALVLTFRSDELHRRHPLLPFLAELERSGRVERLDLAPFDRREVAEQLRAITGRDLEPDLVTSIHARSGGNPFFGEELLIAAGEVGGRQLPTTLRDVLLARIAELAEPTQEFLRVASAAGQRVEPELLATAVGLDEAALYDALREAVGRQILVPDPTVGIERYAFRHALVQEAVYLDLLPGDRTRLHSAFARELEWQAGGDPSRAAELAYHWYAAHDLPRALHWAVLAGDTAGARYAFAEAVTHYERAVELWDQVPDAEEHAGRDRPQLLASLAGVAAFHEPAKAVTMIESAIRLVDETEAPVRVGLLYERLGRFAWFAGRGELTIRSYRKALELIPAEPASESRARAVAGLAQTLFLNGRFDESRPLADEALALARAVGSRAIEGHALDTRGVDRAIVGDFDAADADLALALRIAEEEGSADDIGRAYANWTWMLEIAGRTDDAIAMAERGVAASERFGGMGFFGTHILATHADFLYGLGRWDEAEAAVRRAEDVGPLGTNHILVQEMLGRLELATGQFDKAEARLRTLAPLAERAADIQFIAPVQASLAELALWQGRPGEAAAEAATAIRLLGFTSEVRIGEAYALGLRALADMADVARARRSNSDAEAAVSAGADLLAEIRDRHADVLRTRPAFETLSGAWVLLSEAESTRLNARPDPFVWARAATAWQGVGRPYVVAYCQWRKAEASLAVRGDRAATADALRSALATATELGAAPLAHEIRALAARARLAIEPTALEPESAAEMDEAARLGLTTREREVLGLVALGRTNRQIADALFISQNTAGVHVSNILGKLGVSGRGEAAAVAHRLGLAAMDDGPSD